MRNKKMHKILNCSIAWSVLFHISHMHFLHCGLFDFFYFFAYAVVLIWSLLTILLSLLSVSLSLWILKTLCSHKAGPTKTRCCQGLPALPGLPYILLNISNQDWQLMHLRHKNKGNESMETSSYPDGVFCALADQTQLIQDLFVEWQTLLLGFKCDGNNCYYQLLVSYTIAVCHNQSDWFISTEEFWLRLKSVFSTYTHSEDSEKSLTQRLSFL